MSKHVFLTHLNCQTLHCAICEKGLKHCIYCAGAEGSLPTECPDVTMTEDIADAVYGKRIDYKDGIWIGIN